LSHDNPNLVLIACNILFWLELIELSTFTKVLITVFVSLLIDVSVVVLLSASIVL